MLTLTEYATKLRALQDELPRVNDTLGALKRIEVMNDIEELTAEWYASLRAQNAPLKLYLRRLPLNSQGYTTQGVYYGSGAPLYEYQDDDGNYNVLRASDRDDAKSQIRHKFRSERNVVFYR